MQIHMSSRARALSDINVTKAEPDYISQNRKQIHKTQELQLNQD